ncbi:MAG: hypothetical protein WDO70_09050 [Alphaproteobacteria bacterium]
MSRVSKFAESALCVLVVAILALPMGQWLAPFAPEAPPLYGYTDKIPDRPASIIESFFDKSLQRWAEKYFDVHLGFRVSLIRSFNEVNFRIFREAPRLHLLSTRARGLYSSMPLDSLNNEIAHKEELESKYQEEAQKLLQLQKVFERQGKYFTVVIASSKPYVYPDGLGSRYLAGGSADIFNRAASFGNAIKSVGVNVIDSGPELRKFVETSGLETHSASGVHWNYYAGCMIAAQLLDQSRQRQFPAMPKLDCGAPQLGAPHMIDVDGYNLLNIWSDAGLLRPTIYPSLVPLREIAWRPSIVFIGDSFSDQMRYALEETNIYSRMVMSGYFRERLVDDRMNGKKSFEDVTTDEAAVRAELAEDVAASDIIILEMTDYNVSRWGYGFADYVLKNTLLTHGLIRIAAVTGAHGRESDGQNWWHWVERKINFKLQPLSIPKGAEQTKLRFEYGMRNGRALTLRIVKHDGSNQIITLQKGSDRAVFERIVDVPAAQLAEISLETDGVASPLGDNDPRVAAWIIRNVTIEPVSP